MHGLDDSLFNVIFSYTIKQAIEDGNLLDVTKQAKETGFKVPVAVSLNLYANYITPPTGLEGEGQSIEGRLHDLFIMCMLAIQKQLNESRVNFKVLFLMKSQPRSLEEVEVVCQIGPDDDMKPCITLMLPEDD
ncbi:DUF6573 family protein [Desulfovibrio sp. UCD-KL4C]|uniref:DUF6573 family protein n=1 Tax=Desulfovibrio sp. UCD-KL4C TaxID=2578120 RepID=UPI0025C3944C|nr:DUF6573 family protein [Desulfovibrio sp. UCD-KL4C]